MYWHKWSVPDRSVRPTSVDDALRDDLAPNRWENTRLRDELARVDGDRANHSERLWALLNFELWQRVFFDREAPGHPAPTAIDRIGDRGTTCS